MEKISIVIVDDHPLFRQGVIDALSLEPDLYFIGEATSGEEGLEIIRAQQPAVAIGHRAVFMCFARRGPERLPGAGHESEVERPGPPQARHTRHRKRTGFLGGPRRATSGSRADTG